MENIEGNQDSRPAYLSKVCYVFFGLTIGFVLAFILWTNQSNKRSEYEFSIPPPSTFAKTITMDLFANMIWAIAVWFPETLLLAIAMTAFLAFWMVLA